MSNVFSLGNVILSGSGKKGILKPNGEGIYRLNSGGFNIPNTGGVAYPMNDYLKEQIDKNSDLNRRVKLGYCKMEVEHPQPFAYVEENGVRYRKPITDIIEWITRLRSYDDTRICGLISQVDWEFDNPRDLRQPVYTFIHCEPFGTRGPEFAESLGNPRHNTAVSIRTQISPWSPGQTERDVIYWTGFDWVSEPGMVHANKHMTAGCESFLSDMGMNSNVQKFQVAMVLERLDEVIKSAANDANALQRVGGMEALDDFNNLLTELKKSYKRGDTVRAAVSMTSVF